MSATSPNRVRVPHSPCEPIWFFVAPRVAGDPRKRILALFPFARRPLSGEVTA